MKTLKFNILVLAFFLLCCSTVLAGNNKDTSPGTAPIITEATTVTNESRWKRIWDPKTSFLHYENMGIAIRGIIDPDKDVTEFVIIVKREDGTLVFEPRIIKKTMKFENFDIFFGLWSFYVRNNIEKYTFEIYCLDKKGNKSNTVTVEVTVTPK
ncbi:hypothetical protein AGMMS50230_22350 [Spirochaetia bacterium]|nr:hypothetical protein AGMMS50230_22350 [Spirochaetia bacterium]